LKSSWGSPLSQLANFASSRCLATTLHLLPHFKSLISGDAEFSQFSINIINVINIINFISFKYLQEGAIIFSPVKKHSLAI